MQAAAVDAPFDDADYFFEPWWPGARALAFIESGRLRMTVSGLSDPIAAFPELRELPQQVVGDEIVLDGTLLVLDDEGRPDAELLRARPRRRRDQPLRTLHQLVPRVDVQRADLVGDGGRRPGHETKRGSMQEGGSRDRLCRVLAPVGSQDG